MPGIVIIGSLWGSMVSPIIYGCCVCRSRVARILVAQINDNLSVEF